MLFNSWEFLLFVCVLLALYYSASLRRVQVPLLAAASFVFYGYGEPRLVLLLIASTVFNAIASFYLVTGTPRARVLWLRAGLAMNLGVLAFFKYGGLISRTVDSGTTTSVGRWLTELPLPIGISFFTFEGISLLVDLYHRPEIQPRKPFVEHLLDISFFKAFFPQLVAGPIVKGRDFLPQIRNGVQLRDIEWGSAARDIVTGLFFKMVVADHLRAQTFWLTYPYFKVFSTITLLALVFGYSMQIFADFAGYSLIARGIAALFGYRLPTNFDFPYISRSFSEFWRRWHISLSMWLREYLYIPLGGNRRGAARTYLNLMIVMALGGLWHGATWSYAIWGIWHGVALVTERFVWGGRADRRTGVSAWLAGAFVFGYVTLGWILFKMPHFSDAVEFGRALATQWSLPHNRKLIVNLVIYSLPVVAYHGLYLLGQTEAAPSEPVAAGNGAWGNWGAALACGALLFLILVNSGTPGAFIYFQF